MAPASSLSVMKLLKRETTMASFSPDASNVPSWILGMRDLAGDRAARTSRRGPYSVDRWTGPFRGGRESGGRCTNGSLRSPCSEPFSRSPALLVLLLSKIWAAVRVQPAAEDQAL